MNYTDENISRLDLFFKDLVKKNERENYYINIMNNSNHLDNQYHTGALNRDLHNYCNWTAITYSELNNGFKQYDDRAWYYVTESNTPESVQIRKDLVDAWSRANAKDTVLVVVPTGVVALNMQELFGFMPLSHKIEWNEEGNIVFRFDISRKKVIGDESYKADDQTISWYRKSSEYLGHCVYAEHRTSKKTLIMATYNDDGTRKNFHKIKSIKQFYDVYEVEQNLHISYKTFQRLIHKNIVGYFFEVAGKKVWLKVEDPASNVIPEVWGNETVEVSETSIEAISVNLSEVTEDNVESIEKAVEVTVNKVDEAIPEIVKGNTDPVLGKPERIIVRVNTQYVAEHSDEEWCNLVNKMEQKRIIIR